MSFASPAQMLERYDARTLGDIVSDTGVRVTSANLLTDANLQAALDDASGEIESALYQARRYSASDLAALTGNSLKLLVRLTCQIAFGHLWERRPWSDDEQRERAIERADKALERLRKGEHVFDLDAQKDAGLPETAQPTVSSIQSLSMTVDESRRGYYPRRRYPAAG